MTEMIKNLEAMLANGQENALLRYGLGNAYFLEKNYSMAVDHLEKAIELDENYSAAWKLYGKALTATNENSKAIAVYEKGIRIAEHNGDKQAVKEMQVFLKRLQK